jgi:UDP-2,3-diacylglucosamine pyrophosphatase LpxH
MKKVAIFMSDFHLGQKNRIEEFHLDNEFAELLGRLSLHHAQDEVDLVLNGDVLDLWTTVTNPQEERADTIGKIDLYLPCLPPQAPAGAALLPQDIAAAETKEAWKTREILRNHPAFFEALGRFLTYDPRKRRILYIPGNHDHSVVSRKLQKLISTAILTPELIRASMAAYPNFTRARLMGRILFPLYYEEEYLQVYAEHGNQLTYGGIFRYDDGTKSTFDQFGQECPGYVQFKTVSGRAMRSAPKLNGLLVGAFNPSSWLRFATWLLVRGYIRALIYLQRFRIQFKYSDNPQVEWARGRLPAEWKTLLYLLKARLFTPTRDEFGDLIPKLFEANGSRVTLPLCNHKLDPNKVKTIILGHSHGSRDIDVPGFNGLKYYNTGSWILLQQKGREVVEQTWVTLSRELPVTFIETRTNEIGTWITVSDPYERIVSLKLDTPDLLQGINAFDQVLIETNEKEVVTSIVKDGPLVRTVIERQMVRRKVELGEVADSPVTTSGAPLNPVLRAMDLRVGDLILFHWNFGAYLWRIVRTQPLTLFNAASGVITGAINRLGTSSYWNHIAMVFGSTSERPESDNYNDPLIIEAVPKVGVGIHTPEHYLEYPKEWDFAVLRLKSPLLDTWPSRRLLRRMAIGYLGAIYDLDTVTRGTIQYAALALDAKGRSALGGAVYGAITGVIVCTIGAIWWVGRQLHGQRSNGTESNSSWWDTLADTAGNHSATVVATLTASPSGIVDGLLKFGGIVLLIIGAGLSAYVVLQLARLTLKAWLAATGVIGAMVGVCVVPVLADMAHGWSEKTTAQRTGFVFVWFSPLSLLLFSGYVAEALNVRELKQLLEIQIMFVLTAALVTVLLGGWINALAEPIVNGITRLRALMRTGFRRLYALLGWQISDATACGNVRTYKEFICSGLVQEALVETARQRNIGQLEGVIVNSEWNAAQTPEKQSCVLRSTMPRDFALAADKFKWTYLYLDEVLTSSPSASHKAQAYTAPPPVQRPNLSRAAAEAIKLGFAGVYMTILASIASNQLPNILKNGWFSIDMSSDTSKELLLLGSIVFGSLAFWRARMAQTDLALDPTRRGRALAFYGWVSGAIAMVIGITNVFAMLGISMVPGLGVSILSVGLVSAILLLF